MTTTVRVLIEGNKACSAQVVESDGSKSKAQFPRQIKPGEFATFSIHDEQSLLVAETGDFIS